MKKYSPHNITTVEYIMSFVSWLWSMFTWPYNFLVNLATGIYNFFIDFRKIVCFLGTIPNRARNLHASFEAILCGIASEIYAVGQASVIGFTSLTDVFISIGEFVFRYVICATKMIVNLPYCILFYVLTLALYLLYIPFFLLYLVIDIILWFPWFSTSTYVSETIAFINQYVEPILGTPINDWHPTINRKCFNCVRLKTESVAKRSTGVYTAFTEDIPEVFSEAGKSFLVGGAHFNEVFRYPQSRHPAKVKRDFE